ncbi:MBL fold metallo-hydrolase [Sphingomonas sp. NFR15]|uniref:MBL fold metallo-hydrolase n=1 Tax=Sphingomonas sp. NFR15 TaxID=1566282 RepID=UPI00088463C1|nr:MBL fold metallo-hydrolase [Sphingomonas sp. NFR15]SDA17380.1 L-ascorbate metabolism protein UlaG, beta-lactamase superfamily [Sphingomonas sp. NFR15]
MRFLRFLVAAILWIVVLICLAITVLPRFLDARYYRGPVSGHFDGRRFANPDGDDTFAPAARPGGKPAPAPGLGMMVRFLTGSDGRPAWPDHVAVRRVAPPPRVSGDAMLATWVGHATVLVQTQGLNILTDPVWSPRAGPLGLGPKRVAEPGVAFDSLPKIDLVLVSHDHYDHLDLATLKRLWDRDHPRIVTSLGNDSVIGQAGVPAIARDWGGRVPVKPGVEVIVTRNHHWGSRWMADRNRALWSSFVVTLPGGNLFFAGDTGAGDLRWADEAAAYGPVRLALIPIGAFRFSAGQMAAGSHIGPIDAVEVYRRLGASSAIGIHWGTFRLSYEAYDTPPRLLAAIERCRGLSGFGTVAFGRPVPIAPYAPPVAKPVLPAATAACLASPAVRSLP